MKVRKQKALNPNKCLHTIYLQLSNILERLLNNTRNNGIFHQFVCSKEYFYSLRDVTALLSQIQ